MTAMNYQKEKKIAQYTQWRQLMIEMVLSQDAITKQNWHPCHELLVEYDDYKLLYLW